MLYDEFYSIYVNKIMHPSDLKKKRTGNAFQV